jgi:hypothetical protein
MWPFRKKAAFADNPFANAKPECSAEVIEQTSHGPILRIAFAGDYPRGSLGNNFSGLMKDYALRAFQHHRPCAVVYDMLRLNYSWGDGLYFLVFPTLCRVQKQADSIIPSCFVATGSTHEAILSLVEALIPGWACCQGVFTDNETAVSRLKSKLL